MKDTVHFLFRHSLYRSALSLADTTNAPLLASDLELASGPPTSLGFAAFEAVDTYRSQLVSAQFEWIQLLVAPKILLVPQLIPIIIDNDDDDDGNDRGALSQSQHCWTDSMADFLRISDPPEEDVYAALANAHQKRVISHDRHDLVMEPNLVTAQPEAGVEVDVCSIPVATGLWSAASGFTEWNMALLAESVVLMRILETKKELKQLRIVALTSSGTTLSLGLYQLDEATNQVHPMRILVENLPRPEFVAFFCCSSLIGMTTADECRVFQSHFGTLLGRVSFPKHDLSGGCCVGPSDSKFVLLSGTHVRSNESKIAAWKPGSDKLPMTVCEAKGGTISNLQAAPRMLSARHQLVLLLHSKTTVMVGMWQQPDESNAIPALFRITASLQIPPHCLGSIDPPRFDFTNALDVVVGTGTHVITWDLGAIVTPDSIGQIFHAPMRRLNPTFVHCFSTTAMTSDMVTINLRSRDYCLCIAEGILVLVCPLSGTVIQLNAPAPAATNIFRLGKAAKSTVPIFSVASADGIQLWHPSLSDL